jgi:hypothetical protein
VYLCRNTDASRPDWKAASESILADIAASRAWLESVSGNYCLIVVDRSGLRLITDSAGLHHVFRDAECSVVLNSFLAVARSVRCEPSASRRCSSTSCSGRPSDIVRRSGGQPAAAGGEVRITGTERSIVGNVPDWNTPDSRSSS